MHRHILSFLATAVHQAGAACVAQISNTQSGFTTYDPPHWFFVFVRHIQSFVLGGNK
jgi:hypothetical protein